MSKKKLFIVLLLVALVVAHYADMRREDPALPRFKLGNDIVLMPAIGVGSVVALYVLVKILLVMG